MAKKSEWAMPPIGWIAAAGLGYIALQAFRNRGQAPQQQQLPQGALAGANGQPVAPPGHMLVPDTGLGSGLMGMGGNGIPIWSLPQASVQNSAMVTSNRPTIPGITPQSRTGEVAGKGTAEQFSGESFGGFSGMGGSSGGENF